MRRGSSWRPRAAVLVAGLAATGLVAGCSSSKAPEVAPPITESASPTMAPFSPDLRPAQAAMAVVPASSTTLLVTDWAEIRLNLGFGTLTSSSSDADRASFDQALQGKAPVLSDNTLDPVDATLRSQYGFGADDVDWEAQFSGGQDPGWAIKLDDAVPDTGPQQAVSKKVGPLAGATWYPTTHVLLKGGTVDATKSWYADSSLVSLAARSAGATVVHRGCLPAAVALAGTTGTVKSGENLQPFNAFALTFGVGLMNVSLGPLRDDAFTRARLGEQVGDQQFTKVYQQPLADPGGGQIGYTLDDPTQAVSLALAGRLPFAVCPS